MYGWTTSSWPDSKGMEGRPKPAMQSTHRSRGFARTLRAAVLLLALLALPACGGAGDRSGGQKPVELTVSAAASLTEAVKEIGALYEEKHQDTKLLYNFGASGTLQKQIQEGAPADLFISAASRNMDEFVNAGLAVADSHVQLLAGELVVIVPADDGNDINGLRDLEGDRMKRIAIGIPESVPAGGYAKEALEGEQLWERLQDKLVQAKDVRQVLQYVETGNADAGFVYRTDAVASDKARIAFAVSADSHAPILYPAAIVAASKHPDMAKELLNFFQSEEAMAVFERYGFRKAP